MQFTQQATLQLNEKKKSQAFEQAQALEHLGTLDPQRKWQGSYSTIDEKWFNITEFSFQSYLMKLNAPYHRCTLLVFLRKQLIVFTQVVTIHKNSLVFFFWMFDLCMFQNQLPRSAQKSNTADQLSKCRKLLPPPSTPDFCTLPTRCSYLNHSKRTSQFQIFTVILSLYHLSHLLIFLTDYPI